MKALRLASLVVAIVLAASVLSACNAASPAASKTTTERATTAKPALNPFGFDPDHPEGWSIYGGKDWDACLKWMNERKLLIAESDYSLGAFTLQMPFDDATKLFPSAFLSDEEKDSARTLAFPSLTLMFVKADDDGKFTLYSIEATGPGYVTPRGLCVGDNAEKVYALYGVPYYVLDNKWAYGDGEYSLFSVMVENGIVQKICVNSVM